MVQYYRDLWARRSEVLAPLTSLVGECGHTKVTRANKTKKCPWYWDTVHQKAFDDVKTSIAKDVVLAYPNYSREFEIYTDASSKQLGSVITQGNRPLAFFSRKLATTQQKYSVTKLDLLAIVETLKEFIGMLWGQRLKVYTDHKNQIQDALGLTSDRVYQWRLLLKEFGPKIVYIKGIHNTVADAISRLDIGPIPSEHENWMTFTKCLCHYTMQEESAIDTSAYQEEMNLVFANRSEEDVIYPLTVQEIAEAQKLDACLKTLKDQYSTQLVESTRLLCKNGKMLVGTTTIYSTLDTLDSKKSFVLRCTGKVCEIPSQKYVKNCHACQVNKRDKHKYGKLPTKFAITNPRDVLCMDLIGPYTIKG
eukprot:CCRYP_005830-RA/>CCRYP_005830-RA protein AED:0.19 eAED:0.19 QI:0/0/0/1/0/0/2/0/363